LVCPRSSNLYPYYSNTPGRTLMMYEGRSSRANTHTERGQIFAPLSTTHLSILCGVCKPSRWKSCGAHRCRLRVSSKYTRVYTQDYLSNRLLIIVLREHSVSLVRRNADTNKGNTQRRPSPQKKIKAEVSEICRAKRCTKPVKDRMS
jgi:hypothetical protein